jgi:uncharacterized protein YdiU (UPF0061 family)
MLYEQPYGFVFDNSYARELPGFSVPWQPAHIEAPKLAFLNQGLATELGLAQLCMLTDRTLAELFCGNCLPDGAQPVAQVYAGHQFGQFSPQLGDGRALLVGEIVDPHGRRYDIAFKGSGRTPFARNGDGKAALEPMLREVILGEAMQALGIPTTRALAVVETREAVHRATILPGAVLTRVAASHIRIGTFEFFSARGDHARVRQLAEYTIARHDPDLIGAPDRFLGLLRAVVNRYARLMAQWMNVGFIHGVMNTDNMTLSGETIDYGPCAFMEAYDPMQVFSSIDHQGRYAYGNQPRMAHWNLARLADTLVPLISGDAARGRALAEEVLDTFPELYQRYRLQGLRAKLGLRTEEPGDEAMAEEWLTLLHRYQVDFTLAWRRLADAAAWNEWALRSMFRDPTELHHWLLRWWSRRVRDDERTGRDPTQSGYERAEEMRQVSPWVIARNHRVEEAVMLMSEDHNALLFSHLLYALQGPYKEDRDYTWLAPPASEEFTARHQTFCGT